MPSTMNISLPDAMKNFVDEQVDGGGYGSASEYVRELLRRDQRERAQARLEAMLLEGVGSGSPVRLTPGYRKSLLRDLAARRKQNKKV